MNDIKKFVAQWSGRGYEKGESHSFWLSLLRDVFGVSEPEKFIRFEVPVKLKHTGFIDAFLPDTKVIIEQKSLSESLSQEKSQSDGSTLTPYEQAQRYGSSLPYSMRPRWIVVCNFAEFLLYDMETLAKPTKILLDELPEKFHALDFLVDKTKNKLRIELELSLKAGEIVGKLYDALHSQYLNPDNEYSLASLNKLCVRLVFCLYAESAGILGKHKIFRDYLQKENNIRRGLIDLFDVLNTPIDARDPYLDDTLKKFPFVNGGLFTGSIEIPNFTPEIKNLLLEEASSGFNWAGISPTIFGAVFESTLNPVTRRAAGMHYTSLENIHKVIDPLFLDELAFPDYNKHGKLDYVAAWYSKAADFIHGTKIACAFLSTNSIVQGESVRVMWEYLFSKGVSINFAHRTFKWTSESSDIAAVHCVIVGFANFDAPNVFIENRGKPPHGFPKMTKGNQPTDGGNLILSPTERDELIAKNPLAEKYIYQFVGAAEFIKGKLRYCLWLKDCPPNDLRKMSLVMKRLELVREFRLKSPTASVRRDADTPALFTQIRQPTTNFLVVPEVSGENRKYIPIGFMTPDVIVSNLLYTISDATLYLFGVLTSSIHMAWVRVAAGRLEMRYRYTPAVYNNFPWCSPSDKQRAAIEQSAQRILDVRANYPDATLADLYDPLSMPKDLRDAHTKNDLAVAKAYDWEKFLDDEPKIAVALLKLYENLAES